VIYISAVGTFLWKGGDWFGQTPNFPIIILLIGIFTTSALVSALFTLGYPAYLIFKKREFWRALKLVLYTVLWLIFFIIFTISIIFLLR
jgi:hypothetical protein